MKKLMGLFFLSMSLSCADVQAACINKDHAQDGPPGSREKTKKYSCTVKKSEQKNFDEKSGACKTCGCAPAWHDDT